MTIYWSMNLKRSISIELETKQKTSPCGWFFYGRSVFLPENGSGQKQHCHCEDAYMDVGGRVTQDA